MTLIDLLMPIVLIGVAIWLWRRPNKQQKSTGDNLTDTQRKWRQIKAQNRQYLGPKQEAQLDHVAQILGPEVADQMRDDYEKAQYIEENIRPFRFNEWLAYSMPAELVGGYIGRILGFFFVGGLILPILLFGNPLPGVLLFPLYLLTDVNYYRIIRVYEVSIWNPEYLEKFGNR